MLSLFLINLLILIGHSIADTPDFQWKDCGGSSVVFNNIDFDPKPMVLTKTSEIFLTTDLTILEDLPMIDVDFILEINKTIHIGEEIINVTLPCIDHYGSCKIQLCEIFETWYKDLVCPVFQKNSFECRCPIKAGKIHVDRFAWSVPFDKIKGIIAHVASGEYNVKVTIEDRKRSKLLACLKVEANLVEPGPSNHQ